MNNKDLKELVIAIAKGLESTNNELVEEVLLNNIKNAFQVSNEVIVKEVEVIKEVEVEVPVEKEVIKEVVKEVIPSEVQNELDSIKKQNKELQDEVKDLQDALANVLDANDALQTRCDELHEQNEEYIKVLNEQETEEVSNESEETFEEVEEVSNDFILANSKTEEEIEADEELLLNDLEANETRSREVDEANVQEAPSTSEMEVASSDNIIDDLDTDFDEEPVQPKQIKRNVANRGFSKYNEFGKERNTRRSSAIDNDTKTFMNYYKQIKSGALNKSNLTLEMIEKIYNLAVKVNNGTAPTDVAELYFEIVNGDVK